MILVQIQHVVMMTMAERNRVRDNQNQAWKQEANSSFSGIRNYTGLLRIFRPSLTLLARPNSCNLANIPVRASDASVEDIPEFSFIF